ncbi:hypothetical protein Purlil1_5952 [Purpureocillium lilacinum]|uniref:Uncharacterized protein n=1 Tax=Purpureocillium lilacinum TaxID=33203 RepID=A0ABR0C0I9_PURLI|nr:hypothetical protein Purlil1_5952 [Purpureocillium lilacinum]
MVLHRRVRTGTATQLAFRTRRRIGEFALELLDFFHILAALSTTSLMHSRELFAQVKTPRRSDRSAPESPRLLSPSAPGIASAINRVGPTYRPGVGSSSAASRSLLELGGGSHRQHEHRRPMPPSPSRPCRSDQRWAPARASSRRQRSATAAPTSGSDHILAALCLLQSPSLSSSLAAIVVQPVHCTRAGGRARGPLRVSTAPQVPHET